MAEVHVVLYKRFQMTYNAMYVHVHELYKNEDKQ